MSEIVGAAALIASLSKADAILHIGPGKLSGLTAYPTQEAAVVLVDPDPDACAVLRRKTRGAPNVRVVEAGLRPQAGLHELRRYSLAAFNGFSAPAGIFDLFPGLIETDRLAVDGITPADAFAALPETRGDDLLIIEAVGAELWVLHALEAAGGLRRFKMVILRAAKTALFKYAAPVTETLDWLAQQGFDMYTPIGPADPDFPLICVMRNRGAEILTGDLAALKDDYEGRLKELTATHEKRLAAAQTALAAAERKLSEDNSLLEQQLNEARAELQRALEQIDLLKPILLRDPA